MTVEFEPHAQPTQSWGEIKLTPETDTPEKRLSALLNIAQNGAETLTVLTMASDTSRWERYGVINRNMNSLTGFKVVKEWSTSANLVHCIEPVGAAARSTIDNKDWTLTEFGIKIKPALIFFWQKLLELNLDSMALLGSVSQGKRDGRGNFTTTAPMVRSRIFLDLADYTGKSPMRVVDFCQPTQISSGPLSNHFKELKKNGLINFESVDTHISPVTFFNVTPKGKEIIKWPVCQTKRRGCLPKTSAFIQEAVQSLTDQSKPITVASVVAFESESLSEIRPTKQIANTILSHFVRTGHLEIDRFHKDHFSEVWLTPLGEEVAETILKPLVAWSQNYRAVDEINQIAARLKVNPNAFANLYPQIATSFIEHSPYKNGDPEVKRQQIIALVIANPGEVIMSDISRRLSMSNASARRLVKSLIKSGEIIETKAEKGNRRFLSPRPS